ncbi:MAG: sigma-70 family RNA polymerase sigma factor [Planctomycetes bacterium]|nr:sigma-70 family RNA polymerase sigma factor [Planctomycetota bacterium]
MEQIRPLELVEEKICRYCPLRRTCTKICDYVEPLLPSMEQGRLDPEDLPRLYQGRIMVHALLDNLGLLTKRQREVVQLYYRENCQQKEIARVLRISQQAVGDALQRARQTVGNKLRVYFNFL